MVEQITKKCQKFKYQSFRQKKSKSKLQKINVRKLNTCCQKLKNTKRSNWQQTENFTTN